MRNLKFFASMALVSSTFAFFAPVAHADVVGDVVQGVVESAAKDAGKAASKNIGITLNPGGNKIGGSVTIDTKVETGAIIAIASKVSIGNFVMSQSEVTGNINLILEAKTKTVTAITSSVMISSVEVTGNSKIRGDLKADLWADVGTVTAIGSQVSVASLSITNTTCGAVDMKSHVKTGSITAIGSSVNIGSAHF